MRKNINEVVQRVEKIDRMEEGAELINRRDECQREDDRRFQEVQVGCEEAELCGMRWWDRSRIDAVEEVRSSRCTGHVRRHRFVL